MPPPPTANQQAEGEGTLARVYVRLRPLNLGIIEKLGHPAYSVDNEGALRLSLPAATGGSETTGFTFRVNGKVFDENAGNTAVFVEAVQPLVLQATEGISSLIIAYGSSSSGKSHSLFGSLDAPGLIPSAVCDLFSHIASYDHEASALPKRLPAGGSPAALSAASSGPPQARAEAPTNSPSEFSIRVSYVEVRGEQIGDLLRASEGYAAGQRIPTVAPKQRSINKELEGLTEVDLTTLEEAILLIAKASAFKKARDAVLGTAGTHSVFRICVEKAVTSAPNKEKVAGASTAPACKDEATVFKADLTFVEAGGVETLISLPTAGGDRFNRSLFFLTEVLLRLAESSSSVSSFDWDCSAATSILKEPLLAPGHIAFLVSIDPSDRYTPVSLPVLRFASRLCSLKKPIHPQTIEPKRSRLFTLHREVLRQSEALVVALSSLSQKDLRVLKPQRQTEWWAPSREDAVRAVAELQETVRKEQAKILLAGTEEWTLLEAARLSKLAAILQQLRSHREFLRQALETDPEPEKYVPHAASPRVFTAARERTTPASSQEIHLRTKEKPTSFLSIVEVPIHLSFTTTDGQTPKKEDSFNLTASLFEANVNAQEPGTSPLAATSAPYPSTRPNEMVKRLFDSRDPVTTLPSNQFTPPQAPHDASPLGRAEAPLNFQIPFKPPPPTAKPWERVPPLQAVTDFQALPQGSARGPSPFAERPPPQTNYQMQEVAEATQDGYDAQAWPPQESPAAAELGYEDGPHGWEPEADEGLPPQFLPAHMIPQAPGFLPQTPMAWQAMHPLDDEEAAAEQNVYANVEWALQASPPSASIQVRHEDEEAPEGPPSIRINGHHMESERARLVSEQPSNEEVQEHKEGHEVMEGLPDEGLASPEQEAVDGYAENPPPLSENPTEELSSGDSPTDRHSSRGEIRSSSSDAASSNDTGKGGLKLNFRRASRIESGGDVTTGKLERDVTSKKLLKEASSLRSEVLNLIHQTSAEKHQRGARGGLTFSPGGAPEKEAFFKRRPSEFEDAGLKARHLGVPPDVQKQWLTQQRGGLPCSCCCNKPYEASSCESRCTRTHPTSFPPERSPACWIVGSPQGFSDEEDAFYNDKKGGLAQVEAPCYARPQMLMAPLQAPLAGPPTMAIAPGAAFPMMQPQLCMRWPPPQETPPPQEEAPAAVRDTVREAPVRPPKLTDEDKRLPHFRASKGGAAWDVIVPPAAAEAAYADATARGEAEDKEGFCLPEEPRKSRRPGDTKNGLLLQATLRPWTKSTGGGCLCLGEPSRGRAQTSSVRPTSEPEMDYADSFLHDCRIYQLLFWLLAESLCLRGIAISGARSASSRRAFRRESGCLSCLKDIPPLCPSVPARGPPPACYLLGGPCFPRSCWIHFNAKGKICGVDSESAASSSRGPPSDTRDPPSTDKAPPSEHAHDEAPQSDALSGASQKASAFEEARRTARPPNPQGAAQHTAADQPQRQGQQQEQQPQGRQEQLREQQYQQQLPPQQQRPQQNPMEQLHRQQEQQDPVLQGRQPRKQQPLRPPPHDFQQHPQQQLQEQQHPSSYNTTELPINHGVSPPRSTRGWPGASAAPQCLRPNTASPVMRSGNPTPCRLPGASAQGGAALPFTTTNGATQERAPRLSPPAQPQWGRPIATSPRTYPAFIGGPHRFGAPLPGLPHPVQGPPPTAPWWAGQPSATPKPWCPAGGQGPSLAYQPPPQAFLAGQAFPAPGPQTWCGGAPPKSTLVPSLPAKIVSVISRTQGGLPTDFKPGYEKVRTVYPPETPLDIPINRSEVRTTSQRGAPLQAAHSPRASYLTGPWTQQAMRVTVPPPGYLGGPPRMVSGGQAWLGLPSMPRGPQQVILGGHPHAAYPGFPYGGAAPCNAYAWGAQAAPRRVHPLSPRGRGPLPPLYPMGGPRSFSLKAGDRGAVLASAPPAAGERSKSSDTLRETSEKNPCARIGEDGEATCFEECLDFLNERVGSFYARRPRMRVQPQEMDFEKPPPCPFRRRSHSRASLLEASTVASRETSTNRSPTPPRKPCIGGPPYNCNLTASLGFVAH
ncbi:hypothetical protein ACSSS7_005274 [Eimeria intestinalis]